MLISRTTKFMFTKEEVKTVRDFWEFIVDMEDWVYADLFSNIDENASVFFDSLDALLHFMENNQE